jgi:predicted phosphodiesterase
MALKSDKARELRSRYPDKASHSLARILYKDNRLLFKDEEDARDALRYIEGKKGAKMKKAVGDKGFIVDEPRPLNPYNLPESFEKERKPFKLPLCCDNILLLSDIHIPYHNIQAITLAMDYGKQHNVNTIFINGDLIDFATISKFERDWSKRSVRQEFESAKEFIISLRGTFPEASIYWLKGNHDIRWEKFLMSKAPEIWDDEYFKLEQRLQLNQQKITIIDDKTLVKFGKLSVTHGHHLFKGMFLPVNPARGAYLKAKQSIIAGHLHRASHNPEITLDGEVISCWTTGCLCETRPDYSPLVSNSQHGFAHVTTSKDGNYNVLNLQIIKGKIFSA